MLNKVPAFIFLTISTVALIEGNTTSPLLDLDLNNNYTTITTTPTPILFHPVYGGEYTELDEFPFMGLLLYRKLLDDGELIPKCGGSLINKRYVLTAAHCTKGKIFKNVKELVSVRLGEYDTTTFVDCVDEECADNAVDIPIEKIEPHEDYDDKSKHRYNDIALLRLSQNVRFTPYIKPVQLPPLDFEPSTPGSLLTVVGWGRTLTARQSTIKVKLDVPLWDRKDCADKYATKKITILESQICAGGVYQKDTCDGDSGGPLLQQVGEKLYLEGIVSFGYKCGLDDWPGVYTNVTSYLDWIKKGAKI